MSRSYPDTVSIKDEDDDSASLWVDYLSTAEYYNHAWPEDGPQLPTGKEGETRERTGGTLLFPW